MLQKSLLHLGHASSKCSMFISVLGKKVFGSPWTTLIRNHNPTVPVLSVKAQLGLLPGYYQAATELLPGTKPNYCWRLYHCCALQYLGFLISFSLFKGKGYPAQLSYTSLSANLPHIGHQNVTVMAPLSAYLVSEPWGLTLGSQCALETVKMDLLLKNFYFVQNS